MNIKREQGAPLIPGFAKVRIAKGRTRLVRIQREHNGLIIGQRVNKDGSPHETVSSTAVTIELVAARVDDVIERLVLNTFYEELEIER